MEWISGNIGVIAIILAGILGRELWLHIQIATIKRDMVWIKKCIHVDPNSNEKSVKE